MKNESGIWPLEYKVLVKQKKVEEKSEGGIILPGETREKEQVAEQEGTLVAYGPLAFENWPNKHNPKPGDAVIFDKYSGCYVKGKDGEKYKLIHDKQLLAVREK